MIQDFWEPRHLPEADTVSDVHLALGLFRNGPLDVTLVALDGASLGSLILPVHVHAPDLEQQWKKVFISSVGILSFLAIFDLNYFQIILARPCI